MIYRLNKAMTITEVAYQNPKNNSINAQIWPDMVKDATQKDNSAQARGKHGPRIKVKQKGAELGCVPILVNYDLDFDDLIKYQKDKYFEYDERLKDKDLMEYYTAMGIYCRKEIKRFGANPSNEKYVESLNKAEENFRKETKGKVKGPILRDVANKKRDERTGDKYYINKKTHAIEKVIEENVQGGKGNGSLSEVSLSFI